MIRRKAAPPGTRPKPVPGCCCGERGEKGERGGKGRAGPPAESEVAEASAGWRLEGPPAVGLCARARIRARDRGRSRRGFGARSARNRGRRRL